MHALKLITRNALRHKLRTALTVLGLTIAVLAYGLLNTVVDAWYAGAAAASNARLVTRNAISLTFSLPLSYENRIRGVEGVTLVARSSWFGGVYREPKNFFAQFAVSDNYLDLYPELIVPAQQRSDYVRDRKGCLVGRQLATQFGFKVGDVIPIKGTIYPGTWEFVVRGIMDGRDESTITRQLIFHWDYLNESVRKMPGRRADQVGVYVLGIAVPEEAAAISRNVDDVFRNSLAETLTETEQAFQLGFVAMSNQIIAAIRVVSYVVIVIIMAVMANAMAMSARERTVEYATLKALGFGPGFLALLMFGESLTLCIAGGGLGMLLTPPAASIFRQATGGVFPVFHVSRDTVLLQAACAGVVGVAAAIIPAIQAARVRIVEGLRAIG
ncbi:ABC transporter permease [Paraburkholderia sp. SIMBA_055]|jgi:putative ABC transport system permease protein|uniref:ABC transport system permease protein n=1 Tax=Paraburkholderia graminis TaxID=60548 RepID=A0ABD5CQT6_9BURK|nr:ABC transporter permease [Paraburkholderia graminis]ALE54009.1 ABC transporter ATP-binding protein [Burkholderia sp. HB1]AXF07231.1 ABC transporter permease [Paraburkholderia graminis]MDQ0622196.1 putative ABC transport system permease protein [Paraburkholderia graminis]MDR6207627.1 putative ABC transport system permease protein [Paraburkholderia graminis]MDR6468480.1 putative ABC transport system permease protein [Paraburkholderia graminis]